MPGPDDEQLLRLMREVEAQEDLADALASPPEEPALQHEPCPACGEPAEQLAECVYCGDAGCLPPELWTPGMQDNCLTLCARCARHLHLACAVEDQAGNPVCPRCPF